MKTLLALCEFDPWQALKWFLVALGTMGASVCGAVFLSVRFALPVWPPFVAILVGLALAIAIETFADRRKKGRLLL